MAHAGQAQPLLEVWSSPATSPDLLAAIGLDLHMDLDGDGAGGAGPPGHPPTLKLLVVLLESFSAVGLGYAVVRAGLIKPANGELRAMAFFVGQIALPLLVFRLVATAQWGTVDLYAIFACNIAKLIAMLLTWMVTFKAYETHRPVGQRVVTATVFAFFMAATNDFIIGLPVIRAIDDTLSVYVVANTLAIFLILQPLSLVILEVGQSLRRREEHQEGRCRLLGSLKQILLNPFLFMALLGLFFQATLGWTRQEVNGSLRLPTPLHQVVELWTSPFHMIALFQTGASVGANLRVTFWTTTLALMKVVVCGYVSYAAGLWLVPASKVAVRDFTFFYGSIPASALPLVFANQFDPEVSGLVASAILFSMVLAGPNMFVTAVFLMAEEGTDFRPVVGNIVEALSIFSLIAGGALVMLMIITRQEWSFDYRLIGFYCSVALAYSLLTLLLLSTPSMCDYALSMWGFGFLQNYIYLIVFCLQAKYALRWSGTAPASQWVWAMVVLGVLAMIPTFMFKAFTLNVICPNRRPPRRSILLIIRSVCDCAASLAIAAYGRRQPRRPLNEELTELTEHPTCLVQVLSVLQFIKFLMRAVNTYGVVVDGQKELVARGGYAQMLVLENILEHGQCVILFVAGLFDTGFLRRFMHACTSLARLMSTDVAGYTPATGSPVGRSELATPMWRREVELGEALRHADRDEVPTPSAMLVELGQPREQEVHSTDQDQLGEWSMEVSPNGDEGAGTVAALAAAKVPEIVI